MPHEWTRILYTICFTKFNAFKIVGSHNLWYFIFYMHVYGDKDFMVPGDTIKPLSPQTENFKTVSKFPTAMKCIYSRR